MVHPQHAAACALSLIARAIPTYDSASSARVGLVAGIPRLGADRQPRHRRGVLRHLRVDGGVLRGRARSEWFGALLTTAIAARPGQRGARLVRCHGTFEGAGGAVAFDSHDRDGGAVLTRSWRSPLMAISASGVILGLGFRIDGAVAAAAVGFSPVYFVP